MHLLFFAPRVSIEYIHDYKINDDYYLCGNVYIPKNSIAFLHTLKTHGCVSLHNFLQEHEIDA